MTIIATGFKSRNNTGFEAPTQRERKVVNLDEKTEEAPVAKQTTIIDEIQKEEPFVFTKQDPEAAVSPLIHVDPSEVKYRPVQEEPKPVNETPLSFNEVEFTFNQVESAPAQEPLVARQEENTISQDTLSREEQIRLAQDRIRKLKEITVRMKSPEGLAALEKQTAFERKNIVLENKTPSTESSVSRYTLSEGDDKRIEIRPNNSFLHDNVD